MKVKNKKMAAYIKLITAMLIWGTLPLFVKQIKYTSVVTVMFRIIFGMIFLFAVYFLSKKHSDRAAIKKYVIQLLLTGIVMGLNWVALFESYKCVDVSIATLCYYTAPVIVMVASVFLFKEKITIVRIVSMMAAVAGTFIVTGAVMGGDDPVKGVIFGLISALLYASVTLSNKKVKGLMGLEITIIQLIGAAIVVLPYALISNSNAWRLPTVTEAVYIVVLGFVHTGIALYLYFSSIQDLPAQSVALCSYIDPVSAIIFAAIFLGDNLTLWQFFGALLILGGAVCGELFGSKKKRMIVETTTVAAQTAEAAENCG